MEEERRLKLSMHYYLKTRACVDNPAYHALHEFDQTTRDLQPPWPNRRGGMTRPPAPAIGLKVGTAMASSEGRPAFHQEHTITIQRDTTSLKE